MAGVDNGGGSRITLLDRGSEDQQVRVPGVSIQPAERENEIAGECAFQSKF